jgi:hypothetical protein
MRKPGRNSPCICGSGLKYKHCCLRREPRSFLSRYAVPVVLLLLLSVLVALWANNLLFGAAVSVSGGMFLFLMYPPTRYRRFSWFHARQAVEHRYATHSFGKDPHRIQELTEEPWFDAEDEAGF